MPVAPVRDGALTIGVSHKMYFSHAQAQAWTAKVAAISARHRAVRHGAVRLFAVPQYPSIPAVLAAGAPAGIEVGAQDVAEHDAGAYTGEVSGAVLAEIGVTLAEIGHAERRQHFGETDAVVRAKVAAAFRNGIAPILCVGEEKFTDPADAARRVLAQVESALRAVAHESKLPAPAASTPVGGQRLIVAYEPVWAIGAAAPAAPNHVRAVTGVLRTTLRTDPRFADVAVIYGGSAGPGTLTDLDGAVDGLFLGRFAHDPAALERILDEAIARRPA